MTSKSSNSQSDPRPRYDMDSTGRVAGLSARQSVYEVLTEDAHGHRTVHRVMADDEAHARHLVEQASERPEPRGILDAGPVEG